MIVNEKEFVFFLFSNIFFELLDELRNAIENDIALANRELDTNQCRQYLNHPFFVS